MYFFHHHLDFSGFFSVWYIFAASRAQLQLEEPPERWIWLDYVEPAPGRLRVQQSDNCSLVILGPDSLASACSVSKRRNMDKCFYFLSSLPSERCFSHLLEPFPVWSCRLGET